MPKKQYKMVDVKVSQSYANENGGKNGGVPSLSPACL